MSADRTGPSGWWYVLAVLLVILSAVVAGIATMVSIHSVSFKRVQLPGSAQFTAEKTGVWVVSLESTDGSKPESPGMEIVFTDDAIGTRLPMEPFTGSLNYNVGDVKGIGIGQVALPRMGGWTIAGTLPQGSEGGTWRYAFGPDPVRAVMLPMLVGGGIAVVLLGLGVGTWALVFWFRWQAKRERQFLESTSL